VDFKVAEPPIVPVKAPENPPSEYDPEYPAYLAYLESVQDVHRMGGIEELASTKRRPSQTVGGLFWAYDGVNLIGTPPRLYNQIIRQVAYDRKLGDLNSDENNAQFLRLLALANTAMADAGIFCWREKYKYELWRPLSGVRADPTGPVPGGCARPTWQVLGAPSTNSNETGFKPPFPAYPSGHATFGAAAFQMVRLFYHQRGDKVFISSPQSIKNKKNVDKGDEGQKTVNPPVDSSSIGNKKSADKGDEGQKTVKPPVDSSSTENKKSADKGDEGQKPTNPPVNCKSDNDNICFSFISDELNGISRSILYQPYNPTQPITDQPGDVRTRMVLKFDSMKHAIFDNAISRIWLGVHWHFDALDGKKICIPYEENCEGKDVSQPRFCNYQQLYQVEEDGSTKYLPVEEQNWFEETGPQDDKRVGDLPLGGVPLGMSIAEDIFSTGMQFSGSIMNLSKSCPDQRP
jgi:hypothetical protein